MERLIGQRSYPFTEGTRQTFLDAREEATRLNHPYIGIEHLLLALTRGQDENPAKIVLTNLGVDVRRVYQMIEFIIGERNQSVSGEIGLTPRAIKVIELAFDEARISDSLQAHEAHLLIALMRIRKEEGFGAGLLESFGLDTDSVRGETAKIFNQQEAEPRETHGRLRSFIDAIKGFMDKKSSSIL